MYYETVRSIRAVLTRNDLKHAVLLHVGRKVPGPHVLLHYANIGQFLIGGGGTWSRSSFSSVHDTTGVINTLTFTLSRTETFPIGGKGKKEEEATGNNSFQRDGNCEGLFAAKMRIFHWATVNSVWQMVVPYKVLVDSKHCYLCYYCQEQHPGQVFHENISMQGAGWWGRFITDWNV